MRKQRESPGLGIPLVLSALVSTSGCLVTPPPERTGGVDGNDSSQQLLGYPPSEIPLEPGTGREAFNVDPFGR
jgi:hypothetical protein